MHACSLPPAALCVCVVDTIFDILIGICRAYLSYTSSPSPFTFPVHGTSRLYEIMVHCSGKYLAATVRTIMSLDGVQILVDTLVREAISLSTFGPALTPKQFISLVRVLKDEPTSIVDRIWGNTRCMGVPVIIDPEILHWLGYRESFEENSKKFNRVLVSVGIETKTVSGNIVPRCWPEVRQQYHAVGPKKEWIVVEREDFKIGCFRVCTNRALEVIKFFGVIDYAYQAYSVYLIRRRECEHTAQKEVTRVVKTI